jgi:hypothetical protein
MQSYSQDQLKQMAEHGSMTEKITVISRTYVSQEILEWLMENDPAEEVKTEIVSRSDVTPARLTWAARTSENANVLGRVAGHPRTPLQTVKDIKEKADAREGEVWLHLSAFATRVINRRTGNPEFVIRGQLPDVEPQDRS